MHQTPSASSAPLPSENAASQGLAALDLGAAPDSPANAELNSEPATAVNRAAAILESVRAWRDACSMAKDGPAALIDWIEQTTGDLLWAWGQARPEHAVRFAMELAVCGDKALSAIGGIAFLGSRQSTHGHLPLDVEVSMHWESLGGAGCHARMANPEVEVSAWPGEMEALPPALAKASYDAFGAIIYSKDWDGDSSSEDGFPFVDDLIDSWTPSNGGLRGIDWTRCAAAVDAALERDAILAATADVATGSGSAKPAARL